MAKVANDTVLGETLAEAWSVARRSRFWLGLVGAGVVVGLVGPFGTYEAIPVLARIGYWIVVVATTFWIGFPASFAATSWLESHGTGARWSIGLGAVAASVPVTAWLAGLHVVVFGASFWADAFRLLPYVVVIAVAVVALSEALAAREAGPVEPRALSPDPAWLDQLPAHLGRDLILLQAQDHYVCAATALGETLIRTTIQEAADALGDHGLRVHRSWWVARQAVEGFAYRKGAPFVLLRGGTEVPVGRTYRRAVRQALR